MIYLNLKISTSQNLMETSTKKRIVIKVGTNVLTRANKRLDYNRIYDLVCQIAGAHKDNELVLVSSGAAGAGREFFQFEEEKDPLIRKQMLASIGQGRLYQVYADFFREHAILTAQALLTKADFHSEIAYNNIKTTLEGLIRNNIIPVINENDVVSFQASTFGDNDQLAALTAALLGADLLIILSDIEGLFTADPKKDESAKLISEVEEVTGKLLSMCENTISVGGTGGMYSKVKAAEIATKHGIATVVTSGKQKNTLSTALSGKKTGTLFKASKKKKFSTKGAWMNTAAEIRGTISVDQGARQALEDHKSLLAVGITSVTGEFEKGDVILVQDPEKIRVGAGITKYSSKEINEFLANGRSKNKTVVHCDYLYLL